jgi:DNA-binding IscR family transcriptional regulator
VFLAVRDAAAAILENTTVADLVADGKGKKSMAAKAASVAKRAKHF